MNSSQQVAGVQQALGAAGACPEIIWQGKVWRLGHPTQRAKAVLEELGAAAALANVRHLPEDDPDRRAVRKAVSTGSYRTFNPGWQETVGSPGTQHLFVLALFRETHPEMTEEQLFGLMAECPDDLRLGLARVVPDFFRLLLADPRVPPRMRPALEAGLAEVERTILSALSPEAPGPGTPSGSGSSTPTG